MDYLVIPALFVLLGVGFVLVKILLVIMYADKRQRFMRALHRTVEAYYTDWQFLDELRHIDEYNLPSVNEYLNTNPIPWVLTDTAKQQWLSKFCGQYPELEPYFHLYKTKTTEELT